ncbi:MAG: hypothetical protein ACD_62C00637G0002 [uncultured bacterium]|nr:MAG: hypothetical protein ACD_62C00637G0002 [uncultured bacterium]
MPTNFDHVSRSGRNLCPERPAGVERAVFSLTIVFCLFPFFPISQSFLSKIKTGQVRLEVFQVMLLEKTYKKELEGLVG